MSLRLTRFGISTKVSAFLCLGILFLSASGAWAQSSTAGTVTGQVVDEQNAVIPGAVVKITDTATNLVLTSTTNEAGRYIFSQVLPGKYNLAFLKDGFTSYRVDGQSVDVGQSLTINATLKVGATATTVEVSASAGAQLQTMNATVGATLSGASILNLPNFGRDVSTFAVLQPGVAPNGAVAGAMYDQNTFTVDGFNNSNDMDGANNIYTASYASNGAPTGTLPTPVESVEEFKVSTSNQTADFASSAGSQTALITKRGSNQFHGSGYEYYYSSDVGQANSWKNNHTPDVALGLPYTPVDATKTHRNRFGGTLGGPLIPKSILGGKTYFFFNYEGFRYPLSAIFEKAVPTDTMKAGVIFVPNSSGTYIPYNLNNQAVTVNGVTYQPAICSAGACDPRGLGINPILSKIWTTQMPKPTDFSGASGDLYNTAGFLGPIAEPQTSNNYIARVDHDFGDKWRWMMEYRDYKLVNLTTNQVDIGGVLPGATFGQPTAYAPRPQQPSMWGTGLTTTINPTTTNDFRFSYTRNYWAYASAAGAPQLPGLGGAVEPGGESTGALIPYNVNSQSTRTRFWDGQSKMIRDDVTKIKGNHLFQFGGMYTRDFDYHQRNDNGAGIDTSTVYQIGNGSGISFPASLIPATVPSSQTSSYENLYAEVLGIVNQPQVLYTRAGTNLALQPQGTPAFDQSIIPYYNFYFTDSWHTKSNFTLTYGLSWSLEMPPYELNGKQIALVDQSGQPVITANYLADRKAAALAGSTYTPVLGFEQVRDVGSSLKYPYNPFYGEFSPRIALAWNPKYSNGIMGKVLGDHKTVIRGGYGRIYGRLNGVDQVLVPLLGTGLLQAVSCIGAASPAAAAAAGGNCLGPGTVNPSTAFRIGTDGMSAPLPSVSPTLAQPYYPGVGTNASAGDGEALDPNFRPNRTDNFTVTIQREISPKNTFEVGYIGRIIRNEYQQYNLGAVPYMETLGGETFASAYAQTYEQLSAGANPATVAVQPFFENALGGASSSYCKGFGSCTAAVASNLKTDFLNTQVYDLWSALNRASSWTLGRTMLDSPANSIQTFNGQPVNTQLTSIIMNASSGFGNYNALFFTWRMRDYHGITATSNFTWNRSLGTGVVSQSTSEATVLDQWNLGAQYGPQTFDIKFIYNFVANYAPPVFRGQHGILGHLLGGWNFAPIFTAQSGSPISPYSSEGSCTFCQAFGEINPGSGTAGENAVAASAYTGGNTVYYNDTTGTSLNGVTAGSKNPTGMNMFANPAQVLSEFRPCILGLDTSCGGYGGNLRGLKSWNLDASVVKDIGLIKEQVGATLFFQFTNVLNHMQPGSPSLNITSPTTFGTITSAGSPRNIEFGLRIHF
jgi:hypothetical protein